MSSSKSVMRVISVLSGKYNFSAEEGLKLYEESVKKVKKVKKVEVEDIFVEMSRIEGVENVDNVVVKEKKARTEKQEAAFEKMKAKRAEMLKEKKESGVVVEKVIKEKKEKKVKVIKEEKEKKPRTEKQQAAFDKMKAKRAENLKAKKDAASVVSTPSDSQVETVSPAVETVSPAVETVSEAVETVSQEDEVSVRKFSHEGKEYLISNENTLYDPESEEAVGRWNADSRKIEAISELEEEEIVE
jgi:hypothetical protein